MDGTVSVSVGVLLSLAGFLFQLGVTGGLIALAFGALRQRVSVLEERQKEEHKEHSGHGVSVARLEAEVENLGREIKGLREDFRRVLDELSRLPRTASLQR